MTASHAVGIWSDFQSSSHKLIMVFIISCLRTVSSIPILIRQLLGHPNYSKQPAGTNYFCRSAFDYIKKFSIRRQSLCNFPILNIIAISQNKELRHPHHCQLSCALGLKYFNLIWLDYTTSHEENTWYPSRKTPEIPHFPVSAVPYQYLTSGSSSSTPDCWQF